MTAAAPTTSPMRKFAFDTVFDKLGDVVVAAPTQRIFTAEDVAAERASAYAEGQASAVARHEEQAAAALQAVGADIAQAMGALANAARQHRAGAAELALAAGRKIADAALEQFPEAPVAAAMEALAREIEAAPRLVVRTAPELCERVQAALDKVAEACGYPGQITVKSEPLATPAAFTFDWGEGRAAFDPVQAAERVAQAMRQALAADGLHAEPLIPVQEDHAHD